MATPNIYKANGFNADPYNVTTNPLSTAGTYGEGMIGDANSRIKALTDALTSGQIDYSTYQNLFNQFDPGALESANNILKGGSKAATAAKQSGIEDFQKSSQVGGADLNMFASQLKNVTGQGPTADDIKNFFANVAPQLTNTSTPTDVSTLVNQYLQTGYQPQMEAYQAKKTADTTDKALTHGQQMVGTQVENLKQQLSDPTFLQGVMAKLNQTGMASSGAFGATLANDLSQGSLNLENQMLSGIGLPAIQGEVGQANAPYNNFIGNQNQNFQRYGDNQNQINLANMTNEQMQRLMEQMKKTSTWQDIEPLIGSTIQAIGSTAGGALAGRG